MNIEWIMGFLCMKIFDKFFPHFKNELKYDNNPLTASENTAESIGTSQSYIGSTTSSYATVGAGLGGTIPVYPIYSGMNSAMQQTICPFCKILGCQDYADLKGLYDALDIFSIPEFSNSAWIEIHYNQKIVTAHCEQILFSAYEFFPENYDFGIYNHYFSDEKKNRMLRDTGGALRSIEYVKMFSMEPSLSPDFEKRLNKHRVVFTLKLQNE